MKGLRLFVFALGITLIVIGCIKPPQAPEFDTTFKLPLIDKHYYIYDLEDSTDFIVENDSIFYIQNGNISSYQVDSLMSINAHPSLFDWFNVRSNVENTDYLPLSLVVETIEDVSISYGMVKEWTILVEVRNPHPDLESLTLDFDEIYTPEGEPLQIVVTDFTDTTATSLDGDLDHYEFFTIGTPSNPTLLDSLRFTVTPEIDSDIVEQVCQTKVFFVDPLFLQGMYGTVYNRRMNIESEIEDMHIEYPDNLDSTLIITNARMIFDIDNYLGFKVGIRGKMTAYNDMGETRTIYVDELDNLTFEPATIHGEPVSTTQVLSDSVAYLLNIFPSHIEFTDAYFAVGLTQEERGFVYAEDYAHGTFQGRVPFLFQLEEGIIRNDTTYVTELSDEVRDRIREFATSATIDLIVENTTPTAAHAYLYFSTIEHPDTLFHEPDSVFSQWNLLMPREGEDTYTPATSTKTFTFNLSEEDVRFFTNEKYYLGIEFLFDSTEGETIYVKPEDFLRLDGDLNIVLHFGD